MDRPPSLWDCRRQERLIIPNQQTKFTFKRIFPTLAPLAFYRQSASENQGGVIRSYHRREPAFNRDYSLISISTPAGIFNRIRVSIVFESGS